MYKRFLKPILFSFNPETAHNLIFKTLAFMRHVPFARQIMRSIYHKDSPSLEKEVFGIKFPNPVGLAGGLDKNGEFYNDMANFGFGFVEIGSLTPKPQDGNPKPRCFRVPGDKAIINRFGINNKGVKNAVEHLKKERPEVIVAANISKNTTSINEDAAKDYETSFALLYDFVDMFVINVSCPNVVGLTALQDISFLSDIVDRLLDLRMYYDEYRPILLKVSPDLAHEQLEELILDRDTLAYKKGVADKYADVVYEGKWFTPLREALQAFIESTQQYVTGEAKLKLYKGNIIKQGTTSPYSLYNESIASFTTGDLYDHHDAEGFINLFGLSLKVRAMKMNEVEK